MAFKIRFANTHRGHNELFFQSSLVIVAKISLVNLVYSLAYTVLGYPVYFWAAKHDKNARREASMDSFQFEPWREAEMDGHLQLKACPHCRRKVRLSQKTATVSLFCDSVDRLLEGHSHV